MNKKLLKQLDAHFKEVQAYFEGKRDILKDAAFDARYLDAEMRLWKTYHDVFFFLVTGEPSWDKFYDRFSTGVRGDKKPSAWDGGYIPDKMSNLMWNGDHKDLKYRVAQFKAMYEQCRKIETAEKDEE